MSTVLKEIFACIDSNNAHKLYPYILQEERDKERLTEEQLKVLLGVLGRCLLKGAKPGPMILDGSGNNVTGFVVYRRPGDRKTTIGISCQAGPDGKIGALGLTWNLEMAVANSISNPKEKVFSKELDFRKNTIRGIKSLPIELRSDGPQLLLGFVKAVSLEEFTKDQENRIRVLEAKAGK